METREQQEANWTKGFEKDGPDQVRAQIAAGDIYSSDVRRAAIRWLSRTHAQRAADDAAIHAQRVKDERYAKVRDDIAAAAAIIAAIAAIVGAFISLEAWLHPREPAPVSSAVPHAASAASPKHS